MTDHLTDLAADHRATASVPWPIRILPAGYRRAHGEEMAAVHAQALEGAGRLDRVRETVDLAAYAVRVRLRVTSADPAGRALASAAPYVVGVAAGHAALMALWIATGAFFFDPVGRFGNGRVELVASVLLALSGPAILLGRWPWARLLVLAGVAVSVADLVVHPDPAGGFPARLLHVVLLLALVLGCPPDLPPVAERHRRRTAALILLVAGPLIVFRLGVPILVVSATTLTLLALAGAFLVAVASEGARHHRPVGVLLAAVPWACAPVYGFVVVGQNLLWIAVAFPFAYAVGLLVHALRGRAADSA
ncbi:hypothetical protein ACN20G_15245 [Streptomyces sp. BI20]|uniref:hypothetical protein n=1 Tax=Streptomyces sp. BI20 TaxID=3403460 RepID=UPI003C74F968